MDQAAGVFKLNEDQALLTSLKAAGLSGQTDKVNELSVKFEEHSEQLQEVGFVLWLTYCMVLVIVTVNDDEQFLLRLSRGVEYCVINPSVCVSVCLQAYLWNHWTSLQEIMCRPMWP